MPETRVLHWFPVAVIITFTLLSHVHCGSKCWKWNVIPEHNEHSLYTNVSYPEVQLTQLIPTVTARNLLSAEKPSNWTIVNGKINIPSTVELIHLECTAKYRVQWGFESYPWIAWNTWTGVVRSTEANESVTYTAAVEFYRVQETSLQTRIPICYSVQDPCVQTAVVPRSGLFNTVDLQINAGSRFEIKSISEKEQFGSNTNCTLKFGYDTQSQKFYCQETNPGKSKTAGKIFLRPCSDPVTCASLVTDSKCDAQPLFPIAECTSEKHCRNETSFAGQFPGIAVCHSGNAPEHSAAIPYFFSLAHYNVSTNRTKRYLNWDDADPNDMLQLQTFPDVVYTNQQLSLLCNASYFYLGCGMYFDITKEDTPAYIDGSVDEISANDDDGVGFEKTELESAKESVQNADVNIGGIGSKLPLVRTLEKRNFIFHGPGRYKLSCFAPVWNTTEWATVSTVITVKDSILPQFDGGNQTAIQYYTPNKRLECLAFGMPKPEVSWSRDGGTIPNEISLTTGEQNQTLVWAFLTFPKLKYGIHGNFTCTATNVAGTVRKSVIIVPADKNSSTAMWFLIGLAIVITVLVLLILVLSWKVRRQRRHIDGLTQEEVEEFINGRPDYIPFQCDMSTYAYYLPYNTKYEIPRESLEIDFNRILGEGEYGLVLYALYKNANPPNNGTPLVKPVAVKTTKPLTSGKVYFKALLSELKIMTYIGSHPNIVNLIGACTQNIKKKEVYIATEFCENESLLTYLRMNRYTYENPCYYAELAHSRLSSLSTEPPFMTPNEETLVTGIDVQYVKMEDLGNIMLGQPYENIRNIKLHDLLQWSYEIACGMEFLASKKVIHGDLAARNVFLTRDFTAKIGDFGLSRQLYHYSYYTKTAVTPLPLKWLAIECLQNFQFSVESDIWAFGITLYEIFSIGEIPYSSVQMNGEEFLRALKQGMRLSKPVYCPIDVFGLMMKCWKSDKKQRPNFKDIANFFHSRISVSKQGLSSPSSSSLSQSDTSHQRGDEGEEIDRNGKNSASSSDMIESTF